MMPTACLLLFCKAKSIFSVCLVLTQPRHGSREIVIICGALSTCDPGYLLTETLPRLKSASVRVSTMALAAELHVWYVRQYVLVLALDLF